MHSIPPHSFSNKQGSCKLSLIQQLCYNRQLAKKIKNGQVSVRLSAPKATFSHFYHPHLDYMLSLQYIPCDLCRKFELPTTIFTTFFIHLYLCGRYIVMSRLARFCISLPNPAFIFAFDRQFVHCQNVDVFIFISLM